MQLRASVLVALAVALGCQAGKRRAGPRGLEVTALFADPGGHALERCLKELARSHEAHPDGLLFFDRTSKLTVRPPRRAKSEPYHAHILHRVGGRFSTRSFRRAIRVWWRWTFRASTSRRRSW